MPVDLTLAPLHVCSRTGVPKPQAMKRYWSMVCQELGCTAGGVQHDVLINKYIVK